MNAAAEDKEDVFAVADRLFEQMLAIPATTQPGRAAKVRALFMLLMPDEWRGGAEELDWPYRQARALLGEFAG
jgi:hypothetical protein